MATTELAKVMVDNLASTVLKKICFYAFFPVCPTTLSSGEALSILIPMSSTLLMEWEAASVRRDLVAALFFRSARVPKNESQSEGEGGKCAKALDSSHQGKCQSLTTT